MQGFFSGRTAKRLSAVCDDPSTDISHSSVVSVSPTDRQYGLAARPVLVDDNSAQPAHAYRQSRIDSDPF